MEKSFDRKKVEYKCEKTRAFCTAEETVAMETSKCPFSVCRRRVEETPFCASNVTFVCIKDVLTYKSAYARH